MSKQAAGPDSNQEQREESVSSPCAVFGGGNSPGAAGGALFALLGARSECSIGQSISQSIC